MIAPLLIPNPAMDVLKAGLAEVVAAELDRLADYYEPETNTDYDQSEADQDEAVRGMCNSLRLRANELRGVKP